MAKKRKKSRQPDNAWTKKHATGKLKPDPVTNSGSTLSKVGRVQNSASVPLPPEFPQNQKVPQNDFLKNVDPFKQSFRKAMETAYEGFAVDEELSSTGEDKSSLFNHERIQLALGKLDEEGFFRRDVTQPRGLGTKCAKTYVTRCLVGNEGTSYKYLGLRMFAHPWNVTGNTTTCREDRNKNSMNVKDALGEISSLNQRLTARTKIHLGDLEQKRKERIGFSVQPHLNGRASYDITLINRMTNSPDLKMEPTKGCEKSPVSWHADSSLEHYSSIAVYQTITNDTHADQDSNANTKNKQNDADTFLRENELASKWSIAMRVAHNSEGPLASRRGTDIDSSVVKESPSIAVSLPSRSAYYMLDDFNHHHQHAVLLKNDDIKQIKKKKPSCSNANANANAGVRYASTHRLLREGHNVNFMLERCRKACSQFHRKGPKIWRSEQLLLLEIESEWIRQFYIQGQGHKDNLWKYWEKPICQLLKYWEQLENRTKQVIDLLRFAAMARCGMYETKNKDPVPRVERKIREKQKKSLVVLEDLIARCSASDSTIHGDDMIESVFYRPICVLLEERAEMRSMWCDRENDRVFHSMPSGYKPLKAPFQFGLTSFNTKASEIGISPLGGSPNDLVRLSHDLRKFCNAYGSQKISDLPKMKENKKRTRTEGEGSSNNIIETSLSSDKQDLPASPMQGIGIKDIDTMNRASSGQKKMCKEKRITSVDDIQKEIEEHIELPTDHQTDSSWKGWKSVKIGLEMQEPWAQMLLTGKKKIETRSYDIPKGLLGKKIEILQTKRGKDAVSSLPNVLIGNEIDGSVLRVGWCIFSKVIVYRYKAKFEGDYDQHLVVPSSKYGWKGEAIYGWKIEKYGRYKAGNGSKNVRCISRRMRSLFELHT